MTNTDNDSEGRVAFRHTLERLGVVLGNGDFETAFTRIRHVTDRSGAISDAQVRAIVADVVSGNEILQGVAESFR